MKKLLISLFFILNQALSFELVVIVNPSSKITAIAPRELEQIFLSKIKYLPNGERAKPVEQSSAELKTHFYEKISGKSEIELRKYWATMLFSGNGQPPKQLRATTEILEYVKEHPGAIAYIDKNAVKDSVKIVTVIR